MTKTMIAEVGGEDMELISMEGVAALLRENGHPTAYVCKGVSDKGDPWQAIVTEAGDTLAHIAMIGGKPVGHLLHNPITGLAG